MRPPEPGHHRGLAADRAGRGVHALHALVVGAGKDRMRMPGQDHVDAVDGGQRDGRVLHPRLGRLAADAAMGQRHDQIDPFGAQPGHPGLGRLDDVADGDLPFQMRAVPLHDLRRHKPDDADADRMDRARPVGQFAVDHRIGRHQGPVLVRGGAGLGHHVGADDGIARARQAGAQKLQPIVELVVAQRSAVIAQGVHPLDHRVGRVTLHPALVCDEIAHRVALQEIAVVEQHGIRGLGADGADQGRGPRQAQGVGRRVRVIVVGPDMRVQVRRLHDAQMRLPRLGPRGIGVQCDKRQAGHPRCQESAAAEGKRMGHHGRPWVVEPARCAIWRAKATQSFMT